MKDSSKYLIIAGFTFAVGYIFLRFAYYAEKKFPFSQEIVLIILGTIATVFITAALISKQSEVELEKEQRVKIFDLKSQLYMELINLIESSILKGRLERRDLLHMEFLTHKISIVANYEVLCEFSEFIDTIKKISDDALLTPLESDEISAKLSKLCAKIRYDLIQKEKEDILVDVENLLKKNIEKF